MMISSWPREALPALSRKRLDDRSASLIKNVASASFPRYLLTDSWKSTHFITCLLQNCSFLLERTDNETANNKRTKKIHCQIRFVTPFRLSMYFYLLIALCLLPKIELDTAITNTKRKIKILNDGRKKHTPFSYRLRIVCATRCAMNLG